MKREDAQLVCVAFLAESPSLLKAATTFLVLLLTLLLLFATARAVGLEEGLVVGTTAAATSAATTTLLFAGLERFLGVKEVGLLDGVGFVFSEVCFWETSGFLGRSVVTAVDE